MAGSANVTMSSPSGMQVKRWYFITTILHQNTVKTKPLQGQVFPDGTEVYNSMNVQADKGIRKSAPLGTVFACEALILEKLGYYKAEPLEVIAVADADYNLVPGVSDELARAFVRYLSDNDLGDGQQQAGTQPRKVPTFVESLKKKYAVPTIAEYGFWVDPDFWYFLLRNQQRKKNVLLLGPTGTGKTELAALVSRVTGRKHIVHEMGVMNDPQASLLGTHRLTPMEGGEGTMSMFDYAAFVHDVQQGETDILLNELSRAAPSTNNILFPVLDKQRRLPVEIADSSHVRQVLVHEDTWFCATANMGGEYLGVQGLDKALTNRFIPMETSYPPADAEIEALMKREGVDKKSSQRIVGVAKEVRDMWYEQTLSSSLSTRETLECAAAVKDGFSFTKAANSIFLPVFEGSSSTGERATVMGIISKY